MLRIGLVMLQGARHSHISALEDASEQSGLEIEIVRLRKSSDLEKGEIHGLGLPGGESTTMRHTGNDPKSSLLPAVFSWIRDYQERPVLGTCAGAILLATPGDGGAPLIDATLDRNAFGSQAKSFQSELEAVLFNRPFPGVFIRSPRYVTVGPGSEIVARLGNEVVGVRTHNRVALTFHPELSSDRGFHVWFLQRAESICVVA